MKRRVMMGKNVGMPDDNTVFLLNFDKEPIHDMLGKSVSKEGSVTILLMEDSSPVASLEMEYYCWTGLGMLILYLQGILLLIFGYILMKEMNHYYSVAPKQETV